MDRTRAMLFQGGEMLGGWVAEVPVKAIQRVLVGHLDHERIACRLGEDRRGRDAGVDSIALYDRFGSALEPSGDAIAIQQYRWLVWSRVPSHASSIANMEAQRIFNSSTVS